MTLQVDVVSDVVCPWCFIAKRRMEKAIAAFADKSEIKVTWLPFELNPNMPKEGMTRKEYRTRKFGSWGKSLELDAQVVQAGKEDGIAFCYAGVERTPNTFDAHRLLWRARQKGVQNALAEALFYQYFVEGVDVGRQENLVEIAREVGMDAAEVRRFLAGNGGAEEVRTEEAKNRQMGVSGVPLIIINGKPAFSGAQRPETFLAAFNEALREEKSKTADMAQVTGVKPLLREHERRFGRAAVFWWHIAPCLTFRLNRSGCRRRRQPLLSRHCLFLPGEGPCEARREKFRLPYCRNRGNLLRDQDDFAGGLPCRNRFMRFGRVRQREALDGKLQPAVHNPAQQLGDCPTKVGDV